MGRGLKPGTRQVGPPFERRSSPVDGRAKCGSAGVLNAYGAGCRPDGHPTCPAGRNLHRNSRLRRSASGRTPTHHHITNPRLLQPQMHANRYRPSVGQASIPWVGSYRRAPAAGGQRQACHRPRHAKSPQRPVPIISQAMTVSHMTRIYQLYKTPPKTAALAFKPYVRSAPLRAGVALKGSWS